MLKTHKPSKKEDNSLQLAIPYHGLIMSAENMELHKTGLIKLCNGGHKKSSLNLKIGGSKYQRLTARDGIKHRPVYVVVKAKELFRNPEAIGSWLVHVDYLRNHNYRDCNFMDDRYVKDYLEKLFPDLTSLMVNREQMAIWLSEQLNMQQANPAPENDEVEWLPMMRYRNRWLSLTQPQVEILDDIVEAQLPLMISGPGGAGKTLLLLGVLSHFINQLPDRTDPQQPLVHILFVTITPELADEVKRRFIEMAVNCEQKGVVVSFQGYLDGLLPLLQQDDEPRKNWTHATPSTFTEWFKSYDQRQYQLKPAKKTGKKKPAYQAPDSSTTAAIFEELQWIAYRQHNNIVNFGERTSLFTSPEDQEYLTTVLEKYTSFLKHTQLIQPELYAISSPSTQYELILLDEAQGITPIQFNNLCQLGKNFNPARKQSDPNLQMLVTGDTLQRNRLLSNRTLIIEALQRQTNKADIHRQLTKSIRCSDAVLKVVNNLLDFYIPYVLQGRSDDFEYTQVENGSGVEGSSYFFSGQNAIEQCKTLMASLDDPSRLIVLARPEDIPNAVKLLGTENVVPVSKFSGMERDFVIAFNLLDSPIYRKIDKIAEKVLNDQPVKKPINRPRTGCGEIIFAPPGGILVNAFLRALDTLITVQTTIHPVRHFMKILEHGRLTPPAPVIEPEKKPLIPEKKPLTPEEQQKQWEKSVREFVEQNILDRAEAVYNKEIAPFNNEDWNTWYQKNFEIEDVKIQPDNTNELSDTLTQANSAQPTAQSLLIEVESLSTEAWRQLIAHKSPDGAFTILLQSPYKEKSCALEYLFTNSNAKLHEIYYVLEENKGFLDKLVTLLFKYFKNGNESAFVKEINANVKLSIIALLQSVDGFTLLGQTENGRKLVSQWLAKSKQKFQQLFIRHLELESTCEILTKIINESRLCDSLFRQIKLSNKYSKGGVTIFDHLLGTPIKLGLMSALLKCNLDCHQHGITFEFLRSGQPPRINALINNRQQHKMLCQITHNASQNKYFAFIHALADHLSEVSKQPSPAIDLANLFNSDDGLFILCGLEKLSSKIVCSIPVHHWFSLTFMPDNVPDKLLGVVETFRTVMLFHAEKNSQKFLEEMKKMEPPPSIINSFFPLENIDVIKKLHQNLKTAEKIELKQLVLNVLITWLGASKPAPIRENCFFDFLLEESYETLLSTPMNNMPLIHWLVLFNRPALLNKLTRLVELELLFTLKDKSNRSAFDLIMMFNRTEIMGCLKKKKNFNPLLKKYLDNRTAELNNLWQSFTVDTLSGYLTSSEQADALLNTVFGGQLFIYMICKDAIKFPILMQLAQRENKWRLLSDALEKLCRSDDTYFNRLLIAHFTNGLTLFITLANVTPEKINHSIFQKNNLFLDTLYRYCCGIKGTQGINSLTIKQVMCDVLNKHNDNNFVLNFLRQYGTCLLDLFKSIQTDLPAVRENILRTANYFSELHRILSSLLFEEPTPISFDALPADYLSNQASPYVYNPRPSHKFSVFGNLIFTSEGCQVVLKCLEKRPEMASSFTLDSLLCSEKSPVDSNFDLLSKRAPGHTILREMLKLNRNCFSSLSSLDLFSAFFDEKKKTMQVSKFNRLLSSEDGQHFLLELLQLPQILQFIPSGLLLERISFYNTNHNSFDFLCNENILTRAILYQIFKAQPYFCQILIKWEHLDCLVNYNNKPHHPLVSLCSELKGLEVFIKIVTNNPKIRSTITWEQLTKLLFVQCDTPSLSFLQHLFKLDTGIVINFLNQLVTLCPVLASSNAIHVLKQQKMSTNAEKSLLDVLQENPHSEALLQRFGDTNEPMEVESLSC